MIRIVSASVFLFFAGVIVGGCSDVYTAPSPSSAVSADIAHPTSAVRPR
jgi:hypothetical protein